MTSGDSRASAPQKVREVAVLQVREGHESEFEDAVGSVLSLLESADGAGEVRIGRSEERPSRYILTVEWDSTAHHTELFQRSAAFDRWRAAIQAHLVGPPEVDHVSALSSSTSS